MKQSHTAGPFSLLPAVSRDGEQPTAAILLAAGLPLQLVQTLVQTLNRNQGSECLKKQQQDFSGKKNKFIRAQESRGESHRKNPAIH